MSVLPIAQIGAPVLRQRARELTADELASDEIKERLLLPALDGTCSAWASRARMAPNETASRPMPSTTKGSQCAAAGVRGVIAA